MKQLILLILLATVIAPLTVANAQHYDITIMKRDKLEVLSREEHKASTTLTGKGIAAIFGTISEIRVELIGNRKETDGDVTKVQREIWERIEKAKCLGRVSEVRWSKAPWAEGHILLKNGRILSIRILLSGIIVSDLLFAD
jgi:hypothetical protein